jgi:hypothetical protein
MRTKRTVSQGVLVAVAIAAGGAVLTLARSEARRPGPSGASEVATRPDAPAAAGPRAGAAATREESATVTIEGGEEIARALAFAATPRLAAAGAVREAVRAAREGRIDPVAFGIRLDALAGAGPAAGEAILEALLSERDPAIGLKLAQGLAPHLEDGALRRATIDALRAAEPAARATGLLALLGRGEPEAIAFEADCFVSDAPEARATAGFLLNQAPAGAAPAARERVLEAARAALRDPSSPARLREESAGILGRPDAEPGDLALLERTLLEAAEAGVRGRAFLALTAAGVSAARVRPVLEEALLRGQPEPLEQAIRAYLAAR